MQDNFKIHNVEVDWDNFVSRGEKRCRCYRGYYWFTRHDSYSSLADDIPRGIRKTWKKETKTYSWAKLR